MKLPSAANILVSVNDEGKWISVREGNSKAQLLSLTGILFIPCYSKLLMIASDLGVWNILAEQLSVNTRTFY